MSLVTKKRVRFLLLRRETYFRSLYEIKNITPTMSVDKMHITLSNLIFNCCNVNIA
jgi:hypothetical protein